MLAFVVITSSIWALQLFDEPWILTKGGPVNATLTMVIYLYQHSFQYGELGFGASIAYVLTMLIAVLSSSSSGSSAPRAIPVAVRPWPAGSRSTLLLVGTILTFGPVLLDGRVVLQAPRGDLHRDPAAGPAHPTLEHYRNLLARTPFLRWTLNSIVFALGTTVLSLFFSTLAGFAFAKYEFRGKRVPSRSSWRRCRSRSS